MALFGRGVAYDPYMTELCLHPLPAQGLRNWNEQSQHQRCANPEIFESASVRRF